MEKCQFARRLTMLYTKVETLHAAVRPALRHTILWHRLYRWRWSMASAFRSGWWSGHQIAPTDAVQRIALVDRWILIVPRREL